jgi:hypothetical protein
LRGGISDEADVRKGFQDWPFLLALDFRLTSGHTNSMKVAVSIPDDVFVEADALARELGTSRSEIYARALAAFVGDHAPDHVTKAINDVVDAAGTEHDGFARAAARQALERTEW